MKRALRVLCYALPVAGFLLAGMAFALWLLFGAAARADDGTATDVRTSCPPGCTLYGGTRRECYRVTGSGASGSLEECETVDAGAPDAAMPVVAWNCPDGVLGLECENVQGEEGALHPWRSFPALPSPISIAPPLSRDPYTVHFDYLDVVAEWGDGRKLSLNDLLRDLAKLKREVRELKANQPTPTKGTP